MTILLPKHLGKADRVTGIPIIPHVHVCAKFVHVTRLKLSELFLGPVE